MRELLTCADCETTWGREITVGRKPKRCPSCTESHRRSERQKYDQARSREDERARAREYASRNRERGMKRSREWQAKNPHRAYRRRQEYYYNRPADLVIALRKRDVCGLCGSTDPRDKRGWHIDHDHACCPGVRSCGDCVRALLCAPCNVFVGHLEKNPALTFLAVRYVKRNQRVDWSVLEAEVLKDGVGD